MSFANFIRGIVRKNPQLKLKLKQANSKQSPFQYIYQTLTMTGMSTVAFAIILYMFFKHNLLYLILGELAVIVMMPITYKFWFSVVDVQITKLARELNRDLLFVSEYFLVSIESGLPLANAIENFSKINRPGGKFFKRIYTEFKTGKSFDEALDEGARFAPSQEVKALLRRLQDSLNIGVDLRRVLENFIEDASEKN